MKRTLLAAIIALPGLAMAQTLLYNDGALIKIDPDATLFVEGGIHNTATGTIDNDGTLEVQGNFLNQGTYDNAQANTLKFTGATASNVTPGSAQFHKVVIQKDNGVNVVLLGDMTITNNLDFTAAGESRLVTGDHDVILLAATTVTGQDANEYIATTGTGMVQKNVTTNGSFTFPIGDLTNYSPLLSAYTGSGYSSAHIRTRVNDATHPEKPADATDFISRYWEVTGTGITAYENTLTGTYIPGDVNGTAGLIKGAVYDGAEWSYADAATSGSTVTGSTNDLAADFTGTNFFGKADLIAFLQGPYNTSTMQMNTTLNNAPSLIPLDSPYGDAPASVGSIPAGTVDWVKIEVRDLNSPGTVLGRASAFIKNDGSIVGLDGTSLPTIKNGNPTSHVAIFHRNHLPIRTPSGGYDLIAAPEHNFSTGLGQAYDNPAISNDAMISLGSGVFGMWRGDVNSNNVINILDFGLEKTNSNPSQSGVYSVYDVNLDRNVNVLDLGIVKSASNPSKTGHL